MEGMTINFWHVLALMGLVWVSCLSGVVIGATFVYKTKREPHETLWGWRKPAGQAFNLEDETDYAGILPRQGNDFADIPGAQENDKKRSKMIDRLNTTFLRKIYSDAGAEAAPEEEKLEETGT